MLEHIYVSNNPRYQQIKIYKSDSLIDLKSSVYKANGNVREIGIMFS